MSKKRIMSIALGLFLIESLAIGLGFLAGVLWYPHIHQCLIVSWHIGQDIGSRLICQP